MNFEIVKATAEMADDIGRIGYLSWEGAYKGIVPDTFLESYTSERRADSFRRIFPTRTEEYYLFKSDGISIGFAIIGSPQGNTLPVGTGELHALYFVPNSWGQGYANHAMYFCLSRLKELGYARIVLWVLEGNHRARHFYEKHGFRFTGLRKEIVIGEPLNELCYSLDFSA